MLRKLVLGFGLALFTIGIAVMPVLAYVGTPGTTASCVPITQAVGGAVTCSAHFVGGPGQPVTFSASGGGAACVVTFSPASATTDSGGNVTTTATLGANCSGTVTLMAISGPQNVSTTVTVSAFPAASYLPLGVPVSFAWMAALLLGVALVGAAVLGGRRRIATSKSDDKAA
jgi:hypothetical protein